jgi:lipoprotein
MKKSKALFFSIAVMFIVCSCFVSASFSYFIKPSKNETNLLTASLINNEISYDYIEGLNPGEEKNIDVTIISNNNFDTFFKLYYKGNVIVTTKDRTMDKLESYKNKVITVNVKNDTSEYQTFKIDAKNGLNFGELELNDEENEI